jgi:hypothetical protein
LPNHAPSYSVYIFKKIDPVPINIDFTKMQEDIIVSTITVAVSYSFTLLKHYLFVAKDTSNIKDQEIIKETQEKNRKKLYVSLVSTTLNLLVIPICRVGLNIYKSYQQETPVSDFKPRHGHLYNGGEREIITSTGANFA